MSKTPLFTAIVLISLVLFNIFTWWVIFDYSYLKETAAFLNVGQGDAELIRNKAGNILVDAGPGNKILFEIGKILPFYDRTIDLFILSHPNKDHFNGLFELIDRYKVRAVLLHNTIHPNSSYQKLLSELKKRNILIIKGFAGVKISWRNRDNILIIHPPKDVPLSNNVNESCLVLKLRWKDKIILFTGDIGAKQERKILPFIPKQIDILKVAHHGSNYSSSNVFLEAVKPLLAIIQVGENSYNHPHPEALKRLTNIGAQIFRTDVNGTIKFIIDEFGSLKIFNQ